MPPLALSGNKIGEGLLSPDAPFSLPGG